MRLRTFLGYCGLSVFVSLLSSHEASALLHARVDAPWHQQISYRNDKNGPAVAEVTKSSSKSCKAYEDIGYNYITCNWGTGHAHHHSGLFGRTAPIKETGPAAQSRPDPAPPPGNMGSGLYFAQRWERSRTDGMYDIRVAPENFLQIDPKELASGRSKRVRASISIAGEVTGTMELVATSSRGKAPRIVPTLTGTFKGKKYELSTLPNGVVVLQLKEAVVLSVKSGGDLDISIDGNVE